MRVTASARMPCLRMQAMRQMRGDMGPAEVAHALHASYDVRRPHTWPTQVNSKCNTPEAFVELNTMSEAEGFSCISIGSATRDI